MTMPAASIAQMKPPTKLAFVVRRAISGMKKALIEMRRSIETGEVSDRPDLLASMDEIAELAGYERIDALEKEFTLKEDLERRYGEASVTYVVKTGEGAR